MYLLDYLQLSLRLNPFFYRDDIALSVKSTFYEKSLPFSSNESISFEVSKKFKNFTTFVALNDSSNFDCECDFLVFADDKIVGFSPSINRNSKIVKITCNLNEATKITLQTRSNSNINCHPIWIEPILNETKEEYILSANSEIQIFYDNYCLECETCLFSICDSNSYEIVDNLWSSILINSKLSKFKFVLYTDKNNVNKLQYLIDKFDPIVIFYKTFHENNIWLKYVAYTISNIVDAKYYLYLDIDMIVLEPLIEIIKILENSDPNILLMASESKNAIYTFYTLGKLLSDNGKPYFSDKNALKLLDVTESEEKFEFIINTGLIAGDKMGFLSLESMLKRMAPESNIWLHQNPGCDWREQCLVNLAIARTKNCKELDQKFNMQLLYENPEVKNLNNKLIANSHDNIIHILHFNGDVGKNKFKNYNNFFTKQNLKSSDENKHIENNLHHQLNEYNFENYNISTIQNLSFEDIIQPIKFPIKLTQEFIEQQKKQLKNFKKQNQLINLEGLDFILITKIDSEFRMNNLKETVKHLNKYFENKVYIVEYDYESKIFFEGNYEIFLIEPINDHFYRNYATNKFLKQMKNSIICNIEVDCLLDPFGIIDCYEKIKSGEIDFALPYNGIPIWLNQKASSTYKLTKELPEIWKHIYNIQPCLDESYHEILKTKLKHFGFAYMANKNAFEKIGFENENFLRWGYDDLERVVRILKMNYKIYFSNHFCYHLWHERKNNIWYEYENQDNIKEYLRIAKMTKEELELEIDSWKN